MTNKVEIGKLYKTTLGVVVIVEGIDPPIYDEQYVYYERVDGLYLTGSKRTIEYNKALEHWSDVNWDTI